MIYNLFVKTKTSSSMKGIVSLLLTGFCFLFYASSVIFSYLFGSVFLEEKLDKVKIIALVLAIFGIFLIYQGDARNFRSLYILTAILAGGFFGFYSASSKK